MWSGGKDSALALQRATGAGMQVARLINIHDAATHRVRFHATRVEMIQAQAQAAGIELRRSPVVGRIWKRGLLRSSRRYGRKALRASCLATSTWPTFAPGLRR